MADVNKFYIIINSNMNNNWHNLKCWKCIKNFNILNQIKAYAKDKMHL